MNSGAEGGGETRGLKSDWFWSFGADIVARFGSLIVIAGYFLFLSRDVAGVITVSYSYVMMCWLLVDLGLGLYGARQVALEGADVPRLQREITAARLVLSLAAALLAIGLTTTLGGASLPIALQFAGFLVLRGLSLDWLFKGLARFRELAAINASAAAVQLVVLSFVTEDNWQSLAALPFTAWAMMLVIAGWYRSGRSPFGVLGAVTGQSMGHLRTSIGFSLANGVSTIFQQLPVVGLSFVLSPAQIAGFGFLHRACMASVVLFSSLGAAIYPRLVRRSQSDPAGAIALAGRTTRIIGMLALVPASGIVGLYAIPYVNQTYFPMLGWVACLSMVAFLVLRSLRVVPMRLLFASNRQNRIFHVTSTALIVYAATLGILYATESMGITAVSVAFFIVELCVFLALYDIANKNRK